MIFISHRRADEQRARQLADLLKIKSIACYLDVLDPSAKNSTDITKHIMDTLDKCSHVIVIFSSNTAGSMWVPFELGAAYKGGKGIGTFLTDVISTPEYLDAFPKMKTSADVDQYLEEYKKDQTMTKSFTERSVILNEADSSRADSFIRRVKSRLKQ